MGILDDAIREHLDLKRKHGAENTDLDRLEKEAFGPSERPGEPDSREMPLGPEQTEVAGASTGDHDDQAPDAKVVGTERPSEEMRSPAEQARQEYSALGDTVAHPAVEDPLAAAPAPPGSEGIATEPPEAPEAEIFDQDDLELDDLDLDLDVGGLDEDASPESEAPAVPPTEAEGDDFEFEIAAEPALAVEQPIPDASVVEDLERIPAVETAEATEPTEADDPLEAASDPARPLVDEDEEDEIEDDEEDLLEETPEFLQDRPEDEQLWFEQRGKPKDFDFDD